MGVKRPFALAGLAGFVLLAGAQSAFAGQPSAAPKFDTGDTAWMLTSTALVLMMTIPGLALFYGGLVRSKNILSTLMHSFFCAGLISITWVLYGYSLAFGPDKWGGLIGGLDFLGLRHILGTDNPAAGTIPQILFVAYQATFAIITPALISGAFAERMRFSAFAVLMLLWSTFIYTPLAHWVWGGGWIGAMGAIDFAGGTVVHISSGVAALVAALYCGKRFGHGREPMHPHNLPFTVLGASLLWVGWFGFNAGSAGGASELASIAFVNTNTAAAAAALGWLVVEWLKSGKPTILGAASGAVAGLVVITPAAGFVTPLASIFMGALGGVVCYTAVSFKPRIGYDDALDVVGVHMVGGTLGALLTGVFATEAVNAAIPQLTHGLHGGLLHGGPALLWKQAVAVVATYAFSGLGTLVLLVIVNAITKVRAHHEEETMGLDLSQHSERAYAFGGGDPISAVIGEPRPAMMPPKSGDQFAVLIEGIAPNAISRYWRGLCQFNGTPPTAQFKLVYASLSTLRDNVFRFRGGDREQIRAALEAIFRDIAPGATARILKPEQEPAAATLVAV
jgi:Amt family ammonium transporter